MMSIRATVVLASTAIDIMSVKSYTTLTRTFVYIAVLVFGVAPFTI